MRDDVLATVSSTGAGDAPAVAASSLLRGSTVGRFLILGERGAGGMGRIFEAYDPELDRKVAIKLVRAERIGARGAVVESERLLREAQAMAKVTHANVVSVYEVGALDDQIFVAMELVDGPDLAAWLAERRRTWREVIDVFVAAGRGLAATHAAGLVHRDFKPSNVVVSAGGVKVLDFGLAIADDESPLGEIAGTPRYMAPEQREGRRADARADQYSFCSALEDALMRASGAPRRAMRRVIARGMREERSDRYASMTELLDALVRARRRRAWIAAVAIGAVAAGAVAMIVARGGSAPCRDGRARLAGVWDPAVTVRLGRAFAGVKGGGAAFVHARDALDRYAGAWSDMRDDACRATEVRHEQSAELLDLRMACLDDRKAELGALTAQLAQVDARSLPTMVEATDKLQSLAACGDVASLRAPELPATPFSGAAIATIRGELARARVLNLIGELDEGSALASAQVDRARALGWRPLVAEALFLRGMYELDGDRLNEAERTVFDALWLAEASRHDRIAAECWLMLLEIAARDGDAHSTADAWATRADAAIARIGGDPELEVRLAGMQALIADLRGHYQDGRADWLRALDRARRAWPQSSPRLAFYEKGLAGDERSLGHGDEAVGHFRRAVELWEQAYGPDNPWLAPYLTDLGNALEQRGDLDGAIALYRRAVAIHDAYPGSGVIAAASAEVGIGNVLGDREHYDEALAAYQRACALYVSVVGEDNALVATVKLDIAATLINSGHADRALPEARAGLAIDEKTRGPEHPETGYALFQLGDAEAHVGDLDAARPTLERSLAILDKGAWDNRLVGDVVMSLGVLWLDKGDPARARPLLERAVAVREQWGREAELADAQVELAQALWDVDRARARALIARARPHLRTDFEYGRRLAAWQRTHADR